MNDEVNAAIEQWVADGNSFKDWSVAEWQKTWWTPSWNIAPHAQAPLLFAQAHEDAPTELRAESAYWTLLSPWDKVPKDVKFKFNARSETAHELNSWRGPLKSHRGIVLANGYYEWQGDKPPKTPFFIRNPDEPILGFAALYSWWEDRAKPKDDESRWMLTTAFLTSDAVQTLEDIHDREPVILPRELWQQWLDPSVVGDKALVDQAVRAGVTQASHLVAHQVAPVRGDGPRLVEPIG